MYEECNLCGVAHDPSDFVECNHRLAADLSEYKARDGVARRAKQERETYILGLLEKISSMKKDVAFLNCLQAAGVDNWEGYDQAQELLEDS